MHFLHTGGAGGEGGGKIWDAKSRFGRKVLFLGGGGGKTGVQPRHSAQAPHQQERCSWKRTTLANPGVTKALTGDTQANARDIQAKATHH